MTAVVELDSGHATLKELFPSSWSHLLKIKSLVDCAVQIDVPSAFDRQESTTWIGRLLSGAVAELALFADAERAVGNTGTADQAKYIAEAMSGYVETGRWPEVDVQPPTPDAPWLFCGPLSTWAARDSRQPLSFLVTAPDPALQPAVDKVLDALPRVSAAVTRTLGAPAVARYETPSMHTTRLVLAAGETTTGHKNFAHFMPLETPNGSADGGPFTVVFSNVHRARLSRCSQPLLGADIPAAATADIDAVVSASITWFRCHDLGHFWRAGEYRDRGGLAGTLSDFELMALEECYADCLGVVCAAELCDEAVAVAFTAELVRYLSRSMNAFADSVAAALELGWLTQHGVDLPTAATDPAALAGCLATLAPVLHETLWTPDTGALGRLTATLDAGLAEARRFGPYFDRIPTDICYSFG